MIVLSRTPRGRDWMSSQPTDNRGQSFPIMENVTIFISTVFHRQKYSHISLEIVWLFLFNVPNSKKMNCGYFLFSNLCFSRKCTEKHELTVCSKTFWAQTAAPVGSHNQFCQNIYLSFFFFLRKSSTLHFEYSSFADLILNILHLTTFVFIDHLWNIPAAFWYNSLSLSFSQCKSTCSMRFSDDVYEITWLHQCSCSGLFKYQD